MLSGLLPATTGRITFDGQDISRLTTRQRMDAGLVHVLEGHRVIPSLSVEENLLIPLMRLRAPHASDTCRGGVRGIPRLGVKARHTPPRR